MSSRELTEWIAYNRIEPIPEPWAQTGLVAALLHNTHAKKPKQPADFIPAVRRARVQSSADGLNRILMFAAVMTSRQHRG